MIKVDENKLVKITHDAIHDGHEIEAYDSQDVKEYLYQIIQQNTLDMDDCDIDKMFKAVDVLFRYLSIFNPSV